MVFKSSIGCYIATEIDKEIKFVYCNYNGTPNHVGFLLHEHYDTRNKVNDLILNGDICLLDKTLEDTIFYHRNLDHDYEKVQPKAFELTKLLSDNEYFTKNIYFFNQYVWLNFSMVSDTLPFKLKKEFLL